MKGVCVQLPGHYFTFLSALFISRLGDSLYAIAIPWISYQMTRSAVVMGSVYAVSVLPVVLFGPLVGVIVDRLDHRKLLLASDSARALLIALIPLMHVTGVLELWHIYVISFILTVLSLLFDVAAVASIPRIGGVSLTKANGYYQFVQQGAELAGPLLAGIILAVAGGFHAMWVDVLSFGATFWAVSRIRGWTNAKRAAGPVRLRTDFIQGFCWLVRSRINLSLSLQAAVGNFGFSAAFGVLLFYMMSELRLDSNQIAVNYALIGAGGLLGSIAAAALARRIQRNILIPALLGIGSMGFMIPVIHHLWLAPGLAFGLVSFCNTAWNTVVQTLRQETVPPEMLGRVLGFSRVFTRLAMPLGAVAGGFISGAVNPVLVFVLASAAKGIEVAIALLSPIRTIDAKKKGVSQ